jgi:hypothetical protein
MCGYKYQQSDQLPYHVAMIGGANQLPACDIPMLQHVQYDEIQRLKLME